VLVFSRNRTETFLAITRRQFVTQAAAAATLALGYEGNAAVLAATSLRQAGTQRGVPTGCAVAVARLRDDPAYAALVRQQAGILVAENDFKLAPTQPTPTTFFFDDTDYLAAFAAENHMLLRGHNFVWHRSMPRWFEGYVTTKNAESVLVNRIEQLGGRYAGRIHSWDVVNEAIEVPDGLPGGMRNSIWQRLLPGYLDIAYRTARRVDPKALLVYNDYGIEAEDNASSRKRAAVIDLLCGMKDRGVPIDALGIQSHISAGPSHVYGLGLQHLIAQARDLGLQVMLTEMDANDRELPPAIELRDAAIGKLYGNYLSTALSSPAVTALLFWGMTDRYTWLNGEQSRADKLPERPLPFDRDYQPKDAYHAALAALEQGNKSLSRNG
jgi:endo-1,4-beta-xylanase